MNVRFLLSLVRACVAVIVLKVVFTIIGGVIFSADISKGTVDLDVYWWWSLAAQIAEALSVGFVAARWPINDSWVDAISLFLGVRVIETAVLVALGIQAEFSWRREFFALAACLVAWLVVVRFYISGRMPR